MFEAHKEMHSLSSVVTRESKGMAKFDQRDLQLGGSRHTTKGTARNSNGYLEVRKNELVNWDFRVRPERGLLLGQWGKPSQL